MWCRLEADFSMAGRGDRFAEDLFLQKGDVCALEVHVRGILDGEPIPSVLIGSMVEMYVALFSCETTRDFYHDPRVLH